MRVGVCTNVACRDGLVFFVVHEPNQGHQVLPIDSSCSPVGEDEESTTINSVNSHIEIPVLVVILND